MDRSNKEISYSCNIFLLKKDYLFVLILVGIIVTVMVIVLVVLICYRNLIRILKAHIQKHGDPGRGFVIPFC